MVRSITRRRMSTLVAPRCLFLKVFEKIDLNVLIGQRSKFRPMDSPSNVWSTNYCQESTCLTRGILQTREKRVALRQSTNNQAQFCTSSSWAVRCWTCGLWNGLRWYVASSSELLLVWCWDFCCAAFLTPRMCCTCSLLDLLQKSSGRLSQLCSTCDVLFVVFWEPSWKPLPHLRKNSWMFFISLAGSCVPRTVGSLPTCCNNNHLPVSPPALIYLLVSSSSLLMYCLLVAYLRSTRACCRWSCSPMSGALYFVRGLCELKYSHTNHVGCLRFYHWFISLLCAVTPSTITVV